MNPLVFIYPLAAVLMFAIAAGWGVFLARRFRLSWGLWGIGAATFFLSQVVHLPLLVLVNRAAYRGKPPSGWQPSPGAFLVYALALGLLAGLSEELLRYAVLRWWARDARSWKQALMFGAGHGGLEAIILGGLVLVNFFAMLAVRGMDLRAMVPANQLPLVQAQVRAFWNANWWMPLLGSWERFWTLPVHVFLAVLVMRAFTRRNAAYLGAAIAWHTLVDAGVVVAVRTWEALPTEGVVAVFGGLSLAGIFLLREPDQPAGEAAPEVAASPEGPRVPPFPAVVDDDSLED